MSQDTTSFRLLCLPAVKNTEQVLEEFSFPIGLTKARFSDMQFVLQPGAVKVLWKGVDIRDFSFVWLSAGWGNRDLAYATRLYLEATSTPHSYVEKGTSKITDTMIFNLKGLPTPKTIYMSRLHLKKNLSLLKDVCAYPLIIKDTKGRQGKHSEYVASEAELLEKVKNLPKNKKFLFQSFVSNEFDWGIMVVNDEVVSGEKSYPALGEFRNNLCNGATEEFVPVKDIPNNVKEIAIAASRALNLSWSRADIIIDKKTGEPFLLEVNRYPGITAGSDEVSGAALFLKSHIIREKCE